MAKKGFIIITAAIITLTARTGLADLTTDRADVECYKLMFMGLRIVSQYLL